MKNCFVKRSLKMKFLTSLKRKLKIFNNKIISNNLKIKKKICNSIEGLEKKKFNNSKINF